MKPIPNRRTLPIVAALLITASVAIPTASAKSTKSTTYRYESVWATTVRFLRADRGYRITDKDQESGFILFVYPGEGAVKECSASLEIMRIVDEAGYEKIRIQISIAHQPTYIEVHFLDSLEQKLLDEQGPAPAPSRARRAEDPAKKG
jgi:hypothetical protein